MLLRQELLAQNKSLEDFSQSYYQAFEQFKIQVLACMQKDIADLVTHNTLGNTLDDLKSEIGFSIQNDMMTLRSEIYDVKREVSRDLVELFKKLEFPIEQLKVEISLLRHKVQVIENSNSESAREISK